jgi:hypothetical protein
VGAFELGDARAEGFRGGGGREHIGNIREGGGEVESDDGGRFRGRGTGGCSKTPFCRARPMPILKTQGCRRGLVPTAVTAAGTLPGDNSGSYRPGRGRSAKGGLFS